MPLQTRPTGWQACSENSLHQPQPRGIGNTSRAPLFVDPEAGNWRLQSNSPCINSGFNSRNLPATDLDGNPRIAGQEVDIGAYEFPYPRSIISYAWLQYYKLPTDGSADFADPDGDGWNNWREWRAGTNPTNAQSAPTPSGSDMIPQHPSR